MPDLANEQVLLLDLALERLGPSCVRFELVETGLQKGGFVSQNENQELTPRRLVIRTSDVDARSFHSPSEAVELRSWVSSSETADRTSDSFAEGRARP